MHTVYAEDLLAALHAADEWARTIRADWTVGSPTVTDMAKVQGHTLKPCREWVCPADRAETPDAIGRWLVTVRARGPFSRSGEYDRGTASMHFRAIAP